MISDRYLYTVQNRLIMMLFAYNTYASLKDFGSNITSTVLRALALANEVNLVSTAMHKNFQCIYWF